VEYFSHPLNRDIVERLRAAGVCMAMPEQAEGETSGALSGKTVVISGTFVHHSRDEYKEIIERNGGKNVGSVSRKTDFILAGANMGPAKLEKARSLGVTILSEDEFLNMIN
jgi:DNA ligase (NAD+)